MLTAMLAWLPFSHRVNRMGGRLTPPCNTSQLQNERSSATGVIEIPRRGKASELQRMHRAEYAKQNACQADADA